MGSKYLGINSKAKSAITADNATTATNASNADKLDGIDSLSFARRDADNVYTGKNTFNSAVYADSGLITDGRWVVSADGSTLYEGGVALSAKYLGANATANDSLKLGGLASSQFARTDANDTFDGTMTFNKMIRANAGLSVGGVTVINSNGSTLYEGGVALSSKYLGINDKVTHATNADNALNADKLGNVAAAQYARRDGDNTFTKANTFTQSVALNGGITVDGKQVVSADGSTLYENGVALSSRYLGINATAKDSEKLGGVAAGSFARKDVEETFARAVNFNDGIHVKSNWVRVDGANGIYFQSFGGGWHMEDATWVKAYGGKSIYTSGMVRADNGIQVDDKWVVSSDGSTLYENNVALSAKYLGKSDTAENSKKLGGIDAVDFARKNVANTFTQSQTFNGGFNAKDSSVDSLLVRGKVTLRSDLEFTATDGTTNSLQTVGTDVNTLKKWREACRRDISSTECGLDNNAAGKKFETNAYGTYLTHTDGSIEMWGTFYSNSDHDITVYLPKTVTNTNYYVTTSNSIGKEITKFSNSFVINRLDEVNNSGYYDYHVLYVK